MARHGGRWSDETSAGIMRRYMKEIPSSDVSHVASSNMKMIIYYTDMHDVDEDVRAIINHGCDCYQESRAGIVYREMRYNFTVAGDWVASLKKIKNSLSQ